MMKSLRCRPPILWVHHVTVTLPHSVSKAGWCPSDSASSPTLLVKASASRKLGNENTRSRRSMPSTLMMCHAGTCGLYSASSASVTVGSPLRQATHFIWLSCAILLYSPLVAAPLVGVHSQHLHQGKRGHPRGASLLVCKILKYHITPGYCIPLHHHVIV